MASGLFQVAMSGLNAAQLGISTTSHNITNASTDGYSRQSIVQTTQSPVLTGSGFVGQGVSVTTIKRNYDQYLTSEILNAQTNATAMSSYSTEIAQLDNLLADSNAGLSTTLSSFFRAVQSLSSNPSDTASRQSVYSNAQALVARFQALDQRVSEIRDGVNGKLVSEVTTVNALAKEIGDLNQRIITVQSAGSQPANDLLDQRDNLISQLNQEIRAQTYTQSDGTINVFIGNGQPLVVGTQVSQLTAMQDTGDPEKVTLGMTTSMGVSVQLSESLLTGGKIGGLLSFRSETLDSVQNAIGRIALAVVDEVNYVHQLGQDSTGALAGSFFTTTGPSVFANTTNASSGTVVSAQVFNSDYRVQFDGTNYNVTRVSDGTSMGAFSPAAMSTGAVIDGVTISLKSGTATAGDTYLVSPRNAAGSRVTAESDNTGTATLDSTGSNLQALTTSDYRLQYTAANTWTLTRLSDNQTWTATGASANAALATMNAQYQTGFQMQLSGVAPTVGDSFLIEPTRSAAKNISVALAGNSSIATAMAFKTAATSTNTGTGKISAGTVQDKTYLPLTSAVTLTYNSTTKQFAVSGGGGSFPAVGNLSYDPATQSSLNVSINGLSFTISGTPKNGDTFTLSANANGVSDNRTMQAIGNLQTQNLLDGTAGSTTVSAGASFTAAYANIVSQVGNKAREVEVSGQAQSTLATDAQSSRDSISGVNLDEEAANLLRYQQAYQASAKIIDIAGKLFDQIMSIG